LGIQNNEFANLLLNNEKIKEEVFGIFKDDIYKNLNNL